MIRILFIILTMCFTLNYASAQPLPLKIMPTEIITTAHDEIAVGDKLLFKLVTDVKMDNKVIYTAGTPVVVYVDYVTENGFCYDNANIWSRKVWVKHNGIYQGPYETELSINGLNVLKGLQPRTRRFFEYIGVVFRGKEINYNPERDKWNTTIWIDYK
ncbi:MAG: hypothetical protein PHX18_03470 [Candidatus Gastranaerophilales bacterium]|nr:hypothetical protein [Candidatus Gastranaerophilales bacterium]